MEICSLFQSGQPDISSSICLFRNAVSEARTSKCVLVLLPEVVLVLIILDILELSKKKKGQMAKKDRGLTDLDKLKPLKTICIDLFLIFMVKFLSFVMEMRNASQLECSDVSSATRVMTFTVHKLPFV